MQKKVLFEVGIYVLPLKYVCKYIYIIVLINNVLTKIFILKMFAFIKMHLMFQGFEYGRSGNPTRNALEECLAALDGGKHALTFASGLGATSTIVSLLNNGEHVISSDDVYGGTNRLFR